MYECTQKYVTANKILLLLQFLHWRTPKVFLLHFPLKTVHPASNVAFLVNCTTSEHSFLGPLGEECVGKVCDRRITVIYFSVYLIIVWRTRSREKEIKT